MGSLADKMLRCADLSLTAWCCSSWASGFTAVGNITIAVFFVLTGIKKAGDDNAPLLWWALAATVMLQYVYMLYVRHCVVDLPIQAQEELFMDPRCETITSRAAETWSSFSTNVDTCWSAATSWIRSSTVAPEPAGKGTVVYGDLLGANNVYLYGRGLVDFDL